MKINIGAGYKRIEGFVNVDGDKHCNPDYIVDLEKDTLPFKNDSVEYVIAHHILEHIGEGFFRLLQEIYRVCEDGAFVDIRVPHMNHDTFKIDPTHRRPLTVESFRLFSKKYNNLTIEQGGSASTLGIMYDVDFEIANNEYVTDSFYNDILPKLDEESYIRLGREANNICLEEHIVLQVIKGDDSWV